MYHKKGELSKHFADASKSSPMPHGGVREVKNYNLSRFACYLVAQNGDSRKPEIAAAQVYFAVSTRAHEIQQLLKEQEEEWSYVVDSEQKGEHKEEEYWAGYSNVSQMQEGADHNNTRRFPTLIFVR